MFRIMKENIENTKDTIQDKSECESNDGKISNEDFYEIIERILHIMKTLQVTNSFALTRAGVVWAQTRIIKTAISEIENQLKEHLEIPTVTKEENK